MNTRQILEKYVVPLIALIGGLLFLITGVTKLVKINTFPQTTAVITRIDQIPSGDPDSPDSFDVYVKYTVGGSTYESKVDDYKNSYHAGREITVRYNPADPQEVIGMGTGVAIFIIGVGVLFFVFGVAISLRAIRARAAEKAVPPAKDA